MNQKEKMIPINPATEKSKIETIIEGCAGQPIFAKLVGSYNESDKYVLITVEAIFGRQEKENICFTKLLNEIAGNGYELVSIKENVSGVFMVMFKRESK